MLQSRLWAPAARPAAAGAPISPDRSGRRFPPPPRIKSPRLRPAPDVAPPDLLSARGLDAVGPPPGRAGRKVDRPQQPLVLRDVRNDLALVPHVVSGGDAVDARVVQLGADLGGDAEARRRIFA